MNLDGIKTDLHIRTEQTGAFRILIEALKEILTEGNFIFDKTGIKLMALDSTHTILIHMKLDAENFEFELYDVWTEKNNEFIAI